MATSESNSRKKSSLNLGRATKTVVRTESQLSMAATHGNRRLSGEHVERCNTFKDLLLLTDLDVDLEYRLTALLGRGRQGVVMRVERQSHEDCLTFHALKIFNPTIYKNLEEYDADLGRIARQVGALQRLSHPNLVRCNWMRRHNKIGMVLMELVEGIELSTLLDADLHQQLQKRVGRTEWKKYGDVVFDPRQHYMQPGMAFYILRKILRGLDVLHRAGYMHCDIKPNNVMLDRFGTVKLIDFGRAISIKNPGGVLMGSPMYMAPEVHKREDMSPLADLYSAGMLTLELLNGGHLIDPEADEDEIYEFKRSLPGNIGDYLPSESSANKTTVDILRRLVAVKPKDRYGSAAEADVGAHGVRVLHRRLLRQSLDVDYGRELESYLQQRLQAVGRKVFEEPEPE